MKADFFLFLKIKPNKIQSVKVMAKMIKEGNSISLGEMKSML